MPKSIYAIAGLGIAACVMLSLMMKNLVQMQQHRTAPQLEQLLETKFGAQMVTALQLREQTVNGCPRIVASTCVTAGIKKDRFAEAVGATMWQQLLGSDTKTKEVEVVVGDERGGTPASFVFPRPSVPPPAPK